jgi:2-hydroxychromene-2-carboxylate isomerase
MNDDRHATVFRFGQLLRNGVSMSLTVDVISDVICPWCYIGKRRLEKAIATHGEPVNVH